MRLLQINTTINSGSTGRIAEDIGKLVMQQGHESYISFGRGNRPSASKTIRIGNAWDNRLHALKTRLFDLHGFGSTKATKVFIEKAKEINPDIIHLHNIHGYYLNVEVLFSYLKQASKPVVWTFHDCWPFTGHCSHFELANCYKWESQCFECPNRKRYPASWFIDNSRKNFLNKKKLFIGLPNLIIVTPSKWLENHLKKSFLRDYPVKTIYNGVDTSLFKPSQSKNVLEKNKLLGNPYILGVANVWSQRKGLNDFFELRRILPKEIRIVLVGLKENQIRDLPDGIIGIKRTESVTELASLYTGAFLFVNPSYVDNFPSTNIESLACGTAVLTYNTGGSPEAVDDFTGMVIEKGNVQKMAESILSFFQLSDNKFFEEKCRKKAQINFNSAIQYKAYLEIYDQLLNR